MLAANRLVKLALLGAVLAVVLATPRLRAQEHGGPGGHSGGPGGEGHGDMLGDAFHRDTEMNNLRVPVPGRDAGGGTRSTLRGGLQLGPPGRWWDDSQFAQSLGLDHKQQKRMDDVFSASKGELLKLYKNLQREEATLEKTTRAKQLDEGQIFAQIDRVTQARGELEKANAHMLIEIRKEMTPDQTVKLDQARSPVQ